VKRNIQVIQALVCALLLFSGVFAIGQTNQGVLAGNVLDTTGAAIPGANIVAKSDESGTQYTTKSTSAGSYRFPSIQLGRYTVTTAAPGFSTASNTGVEVRVGTTTGLDITLTVGASDKVTV